MEGQLQRAGKLCQSQSQVKNHRIKPSAVKHHFRNAHPVFKTIEAADGKGIEWMNPQTVPIAWRPRQAFFIGWHQLAMHRTNDTVRSDIHP